MTDYTVRYAHLEELPSLSVGDVVHRRAIVGRMGTSGQSKNNHLHIDVIQGLINKIVRLSEIGYEKTDTYRPNIKQLNYFIDKELFNKDIVITTPYYDPEYKRVMGKDHPAYDVVPEDRHKSTEHFNIHWNRSMPGVVLGKGSDSGYGYYILIGYET